MLASVPINSSDVRAALNRRLLLARVRHRGTWSTVSKLPRILLILTEFPPRIGGMQTHALYLSKHLAQRGYPIEVMTYQPCKEHEVGEVRATDRELPFKVHRSLSRLGYFNNFEIIERCAARFKPDLVYCSTVFYGDLARRLNIPVISRSVGNDVLRPWIAYPFKPLSRVVSSAWLEDPLHRTFRQLDYPEPIEALYRERRRQLMIAAARQQTRVLANSEFTANLLREIGVAPERVHVLVGGVDSHKFDQAPDPTGLREAWGIPEDRFLMMTACRLVRKKGVDFLIESLENLVERVPDLHLLVVGSGRHKSRFERMAKSSKARDHITFTGRIPHEQIHRFYAAADAFVLASRVQVDPLTGLKDAETMGRVLCEANAAGIPVIAARSGGIPSVIRHKVNGLLFRPDDPDALIEAIETLRQDPALRVQLIEQGRKIAREEFDWSVIVRAHEEHFAQVLGLTLPEPVAPAAIFPAATAALAAPAPLLSAASSRPAPASELVSSV